MTGNQFAGKRRRSDLPWRVSRSLHKCGFGATKRLSVLKLRGESDNRTVGRAPSGRLASVEQRNHLAAVAQ
ncbi:MAG: hypothetical protein JXO22_10980, partial [Phycisphaerae bacterium]|nr:hypothetical protein [Phycisphaerae bacterium]